jgi:hypothetical protein
MHTASLQALSALLTHARAGTITTPARAVLGMATSAAAPPPPLPSAPNASTPPSEGEDVIVQAVVVRRDLLSTMEWPVGSVIAQACHACLAVAWEHREDACVADYLAAGKINSMHKVIKECKGEAQVYSPRLRMGQLPFSCAVPLHRRSSCVVVCTHGSAVAAGVGRHMYLSHAHHLLTAPFVLPLCAGGAQLTALAEKLTAEGVAHKLWIEQPEGIPTAIALKPYPKSFVGPLLKKYSLFK